MSKIKVKNPIVDINGDEMARVIWKRIKEELILPNVEIDLLEYDLGLKNRNFTNDYITIEAAQAIKKNKVGVKCATITPDDKRVKEFKLKKKFSSPNGTIRNILSGTIFREPIICKNIPKMIPHWDRPVIIARHAFGDIYKSKDLIITEPGELSLNFKSKQTKKNFKFKIYDFESPGIAMGMYNIDKSISDFATSCFNYALSKKISVFLSTKNTILQNYDEKFKQIFDNIFEKQFKREFKSQKISYQHRLIDDMVACLLKWRGDYLWACKNYDGDVMSDLVAQGYGSLGLMTSVLQSPDGKIIETEAAHGTVTNHFRQHQNGDETSTNPIASIFAWSKALWFRGNIDKNKKLQFFTKQLEKACIELVETGYVTKDLALIIGPEQKWLTTNEFLKKLKEKLKVLLN
tara:strand:- start:571 stop:1785 length:1215 start_codon:yes stop_codon:yes gene_type:complete